MSLNAGILKQSSILSRVRICTRMQCEFWKGKMNPECCLICCLSECQTNHFLHIWGIRSGSPQSHMPRSRSCTDVDPALNRNNITHTIFIGIVTNLNTGVVGSDPKINISKVYTRLLQNGKGKGCKDLQNQFFLHLCNDLFFLKILSNKKCLVSNSLQESSHSSFLV